LPDGLARWLHGYFASHSEPYPVKLETIREAAGLTTERIAHMRTLVENALNELTRVQFLKAWRIQGPNSDLVIVERVNAPRQELEFAE